MEEIKFKIEKELGKISESSKGWTKELNLISGMKKKLNMICEIGHLSMRRWGRVLL